jgi:glycosyltransferase involved in cell wall biosynthesis
LEKFPFALKPVKESPVIAIIGTICPRKRPDLGLKSLKELTKHYPNAKLKFIGDGPLRQEIEDMTHQMLLDDNVIFTGQVADIPDALEHVNLLWMLSDYEGLGMVSVEAMACGVPVIGSDVAGTQDVIDNGVTGYLVPWNDVGATVDRTLKLVRNPELMKSFAYAGRKRAENHFASGKMVDGHEAVFLEVVSTTVNS